MQQQAEEFRRRYAAVKDQIQRVIVGHDEVVHGVLTCLFVGGHCLLEGVPGLGKTLLIRTLAETLSLPFNRVQFTPDLMPSDILGTNIITETPEGRRVSSFKRARSSRRFASRTKINRATPKTQSALLETMQEGTVTVAGIRYTLDKPFFVMATQNPIEQEGTYPLPEAQLDRFMFKLTVGYSTRRRTRDRHRSHDARRDHHAGKVMDGAEIVKWQKLIREVILAQHVQDYIVRLALAHPPARPFRPAGDEQVSPLGREPSRARKRSALAANFEPSWKGDIMSVSRTSAASTCRRCGTASSPTSKPKPKASNPTVSCWRF